MTWHRTAGNGNSGLERPERRAKLPADLSRRCAKPNHRRAQPPCRGGDPRDRALGRGPPRSKLCSPRGTGGSRLVHAAQVQAHGMEHGPRVHAERRQERRHDANRFGPRRHRIALSGLERADHERRGAEPPGKLRLRQAKQAARIREETAIGGRRVCGPSRVSPRRCRALPARHTGRPS